MLRASLPILDGSVELAGLADPVVVQRDALGVVAIRGSSRLDLARATGFVHAQDRFFQMDLARRRAAGELAAMFGPAALETDRENRLHRFRHRAEQVLAHAEEAEISILEAYAAGVNAWINSGNPLPVEYLATFDPQTRLILVGDASMAPYELMAADGSIHVEERSGKPSIEQLKFLAQTFPHSVWLNPASSQLWDFTPTIKTIRQIFPMFELTLDGLE